MKLLYLTNGFPWPLTSDFLRHYHFIRELSKDHDITLLSLVNGTFADEHTDALAPYTRNVRTFASAQLRRSPTGKLIRGLRMVTGTEEAVRRMRDAVEEMAAKEAFDAIFFSGKRSLSAIQGVTGIPLVVDICDAASIRCSQRLKHCNLLRKPQVMLGRAWMQRVEQQIMARASHMLFASCRDRETLLGERTDEATVVPNGVDPGF